MVIEKLNIIDFSGTQNTVIEMKDGINIIEGENESGKSTITAFIKFMLYGFSDKAERMRYYSFGRKTASGTMTVSVKDGKYRIDRSYTEGASEKLRVINLNSGVTEKNITSPGYDFLGVPENLYTSSCYIGQAVNGNIGGEKISVAIENILFSGNESIGTDKALKKLDDARVRLLYKNRKGGLIYEMKNERDELHLRLEKAKKENSSLIEKEGSLRETREKIAENKRKMKELSEKAEYYNAAKKYREIDRYNSLDEKIKEAEREYSEYRHEMAKNGFFPSQKLIARLNELEKRSDELEDEYNKANYELAEHNTKAHEVQLISEQLEKVSSFGGENGIRSKLKSIDKIKHRTKIAAYFFLAFTLIFGAVCALTFATDFLSVIIEKLPITEFIFGIASGGAAALSLVVMIILFAVGNHQAAAELKILKTFDVDDRDDIDDILSKLNYSHVLMTMHNTKSNDLKNRINALDSEIRALNEEIENTIRPIGADNIRDAVSVVMKSMANEESLLGKSEKYILARDTIGTGYSEEEITRLRNILNGRPYDEGCFDEREMENITKQYNFYSRSTELLSEKEKELEKDVAVLNATVEPPTILADSLLCLSRDIETAAKQHKALVLAMEALYDAADDLRAAISPRLSKRASEILESVTDSRYSSIGVGTDMQMEYTAHDGMNHGIEYMSYGTREMAYISLRFALIEILFSRESPSMIFDESFACIDDTRLGKILSILSEKQNDGVQILLFTSQMRDAECALSQGMKFNHIKL